jgi:hypothetical protein
MHRQACVGGLIPLENFIFMRSMNSIVQVSPGR